MHVSRDNFYFGHNNEVYNDKMKSVINYCLFVYSHAESENNKVGVVYDAKFKSIIN